jgi:ATP-binding cassette subfamily F protein 3
MALTCLSHANLLVLDEPTNHLDVENIEALEDALDEFEGTVLLVSHDRAFLREVATRVWAFDGNRIVDFDGPFVEWEDWRKDKAAQAARAAADAAGVRKEKERAQSKRNAASQEDDHAARRARKKAAEDAERAAGNWEKRVAELESQLADADLYTGSADGAKKAAQLNKELAKARTELDAALAAWAEVSESR